MKAAAPHTVIKAILTVSLAVLTALIVWFNVRNDQYEIKFVNYYDWSSRSDDWYRHKTETDKQFSDYAKEGWSPVSFQVLRQTDDICSVYVVMMKRRK